MALIFSGSGLKFKITLVLRFAMPPFLLKIEFKNVLNEKKKYAQKWSQVSKILLENDIKAIFFYKSHF